MVRMGGGRGRPRGQPGGQGQEMPGRQGQEMNSYEGAVKGHVERRVHSQHCIAAGTWLTRRGHRGASTVFTGVESLYTSCAHQW
jgi:hypothetical protein